MCQIPVQGAQMIAGDKYHGALQMECFCFPRLSALSPPPHFSSPNTHTLTFFLMGGWGSQQERSSLQRNLLTENPMSPLFPLLYPPLGLKSFNWFFDISFEKSAFWSRVGIF